ncbi:MAG: flagellar biosynthesis protein FlgE [Deltaproteobacteria bacterium]|nr:MAG: flagellar biosynthesis protein FlgE [Deltaproteobacteria bacterium]
MSLSSALFSGISGLSSLGNSMQIIGDNIANVNTVGYKGSTFTFQDLLAQSIATQSGPSQVGRGTAIGDIYSTFEQGAFESTGNTTDLAIGGNGFFVVKESGTENLYYTRAGNFRFDKDGNLVNPEGYIVQGWELDDDGEDTGSITNITLSSFTSPPEESTAMTIITNLDSDATGNSGALHASWDATASTYMPDTAYEYQTTVKVYDSLGSTHDITVYFDKTATSTWEYVVVCNPDEDSRSGATGEAKGLLARGTINFSDSSGTIDSSSGMTMYRFNGTDWTDPSDSTNWTAVSVNTAGYLTFAPDFLGGTDTAMTIALDLGSHSESGSWVNDSLTTTQYARASTTSYQTANGYGAGDLQAVDVSVDGIITGVYTNGQLIPLYRVALAKFQNNQGLKKVGGNLYRETLESGDAVTNRPGTAGLGSIASNSLEQSNVDIANEFVRMITTQRGFQANSKIITVTDQMLSDLINLKR